jgi:hypothetical protein
MAAETPSPARPSPVSIAYRYNANTFDVQMSDCNAEMSDGVRALAADDEI